ncbi:MAG: FG-GAP-like repeat-containing protein [Ardenticatenaceae bacterium]
MLKRSIRFLSVLTILGLFLALITMQSAPSQVASAQSEEIPQPLPDDCVGVAPLDDPDACCAFGYVYHNDEPIAGATVRIESANATWEDTTGDYGVSDDPHYQLDLTTDLEVSPGDMITITVSHNDMTSTRTWTVQPGSQQVDVGLIEGYQAEASPSGHGNVYFTPPSQSLGTASDATRSVVWGDVDDDGDLDLAVGNDGSQNVIYLNDGTGDLSTTVNFGTGSDKTYSLAWGDMNGDAHLDLAVGNYGRQNVVYLNDGSGNLSSRLNVGTGSDNTTSLAWADANHDGHLDLAIANDGAQNVVYLNNGQGAFSSTANFGTGSDATQSMVWGDVDNDGHLDLAVGNYGQQNRVYLNDGNATFATSLTFGTGSDKTFSVDVGDLNGDGPLDIYQTSISSDHRRLSYVHMNDGTGNFDTRGIPHWPYANHSRVVALADADGDGDLDLALSGELSTAGVVLLNDGSGQFPHARFFDVVYGTATYAIAWGDADGDGDLDLAVGNNGQPNVMALNHQRNNPSAYRTATVLLEDLGGSTAELAPAYTEGAFKSFYIFKEENGYSLWVNNFNYRHPYYDSKEQKLESQDGLLWSNRTDTNLVRDNARYRFLLGLRNVINNGNTYEGWEEYYYEWSSGWGFAVRYVTSVDGISWTVVNQPALTGGRYASVAKDSNTYRMWVEPDGDSNYTNSRSLRYRTSSAGGSGWGNWLTGGTLVQVDGEEVMYQNHVRQLSDSSYELFYLHGSQINVATSSDGINFTTQTIGLVDAGDFLDARFTDFAVVEVDGEDWFYFTNGDKIVVSRPAELPEITPPTAAFTASPLSGTPPLNVQFTDQSSGDISSWTSDFGDGTISGARHPEHEYAIPGTYTVSLTVSGPGGPNDMNVKVGYITVSEPTEAKTLILTNRQKVEALHGASSATQLMSKLGELAAHERVKGLVIAVENEPSVASAYAAWDADPTSTVKANAVTSAIKGVIDAKLVNYLDVEYIVVAGDDRVIPFRRVRDKTWYSERRYCYKMSSDSVTGAALCDDMTLTDDYYADRVPFVPQSSGWDGHETYLPDFGIGRLIETPQEMRAQIDTFLGDDGISTTNAAVTGYTFVTDAGQKSCGVLNDAGVTTDCSLVGQNWSKNDFISKVLNSPHDLVSINGHANHYQIGAPNGSPVTSEDIANAPDTHQGALFYTIACHSGLNVPPSNRYPLDTAQALAQKQANYVANTGYGYGFRYSVGLSEQLMLNFTKQLTRNEPTTLGQALTAAKQQYYLHDHSFGYYDEKILIESVLYGLPMYQVSSSQPAPTSEAGEELPEGVVVEEQGIPLDGAFSKTQIRFELPALTEETTDDGTYYSLGGLIDSEHGKPIQPKLPFEVSISGTKAHGLVFKGGTYSDISPFDPLIADAFTLTQPSRVLIEPPFTQTNWYPAILPQLNILNNGANAQMTALLGQYNNTIAGGTERLYSELSVDVYYHTDSDDWTQPTITSVNSELATDTATVTVTTSDESGIHEVLVTHTDQNGTWQSTTLTDNGDAWSGTFPASANTDFFVQVVDKAGNVTVDHNNGAYYSLQSEPEGVQIALVAGWNLISLPVQPNSTAIADVLASIAGNYSAVYAYDGCDTQDQWKKFDPNPPPFSPPNDLTDIDQTIGFWIKMTAADTLEVTGAESATTIALCSGWNMVAYPSPQEGAVGDALNSIAGAYTLVNKYDPADTNDPWKKYDPNPPPFSPPNDLNVMSPGFGYWIKANQDNLNWLIDN